MKRIKLFEAFNNGYKIKKVNFLVFCWCFESFIKEKIQDGLFEYRKDNPDYFIVSKVIDRQYNFLLYYPGIDSVLFSMHDDSYREYFISKKYIIYPFYLSDYEDEVLFVLKKLYQDEKNKAI